MRVLSTGGFHYIQPWTLALQTELHWNHTSEPVWVSSKSGILRENPNYMNIPEPVNRPEKTNWTWQEEATDETATEQAGVPSGLLTFTDIHRSYQCFLIPFSCLYDSKMRKWEKYLILHPRAPCFVYKSTLVCFVYSKLTFKILNLELCRKCKFSYLFPLYRAEGSFQYNGASLLNDLRD